MQREAQESFDQVVPNAGNKREQFLGEVMKRTNAAGLGIELAVTQPKKREDRYVLRGSIVFGNMWKGKRPYMLEVYADPIGNMLQTGWQLTTNELGGFLASTNAGARIQEKQAKIAGDPNTIRQLNGVLQAFHQGVFLPVLQLLSDSVAGAAQNTGGFLGA